MRVQTRALERLPSLSWQEQLQPLDVPLTTIRRASCQPDESDEQVQQQ